MTQTEAENRADVRLSGRELARQRRKAMAVQGKPAVKGGRQTDAATGSREQSSTPLRRESAVKTVRAPAKAIAPSGRATARHRREAMARAGKAELPHARTAAEATRQARRSAPSGSSSAPLQPDEAACSCGCQDSGGDRRPARESTESVAPRRAAPTAGRSLTPREISERMARNQVQNGGREIARARRKALTQEGKAGLRRAAQATRIAKYLPEKDWRSVIEKGVTGRQVAMQRRKVRALTGRGESDANRKVADRRPAERRAARAVTAPPKVEEGHTLSGHTITGTMVERAGQVTGNESGSCRAITGTEYIGIEQFDAFCQSRPESGPTKVTLSRTLQGRAVSGTDVAPRPSVTGTEQGACRELTGTQYLSADFFESVCSTKPRQPADKLGVTTTDKGRPLTGALVSRQSRVTGGEAGSAREITGTRYGRSRDGVEAPGKVAVTHTAGGSSVTGTALGHSVRITGDESGACRAVSGTEYLSAEQYTEICASEAPPRSPRKVSVMSTSHEQSITGSAVGRDRKVTGGEAGSCRAITGTPYFNSQDFGEACAVQAPSKVGTALTQGGLQVSGTEVRPDPKMTGDEEGRCALVTGTDYVGAQDLRTACEESTPADHPVAKSRADQTWRGETVTGSAFGRSNRVTGNEAGSCAPISGSSYIGRDQYVRYCEPQSAEEQLARVPTRGVVSAADVTGDRPGAGGSAMTGDERGACEPITGTPYLGADNMSAECATGDTASGRYFSRHGSEAPTPQSPAPQTFSVASPARQAFEEREGRDITGARVGGERITGSSNRAQGLITGTPEFRHRETLSQSVQAEQAAETERQRLTGEAAQRSARITGDAWGTQSRVTGTEGHFAMSRNQTQRGAPRGEGRSAQGFRAVERPEVPESRVTGSAGATQRGAVVTVSGGARG